MIVFQTTLRPPCIVRKGAANRINSSNGCSMLGWSNIGCLVSDHRISQMLRWHDDGMLLNNGCNTAAVAKIFWWQGSYIFAYPPVHLPGNGKSTICCWFPLKKWIDLCSEYWHLFMWFACRMTLGDSPGGNYGRDAFARMPSADWCPPAVKKPLNHAWLPGSLHT